MAETPETPTPSLAERIDVFLAAPGVSDATSDDLLRAAAARLRKLDRIEAALGDVWTADEIRWAVGDGPLDVVACRRLDAVELTELGRSGTEEVI